MCAAVGIAVDLVVGAVCVVGLWIGAHLLVTGSVRVARRVGLSELVIGLTVVAIGTSSPEFAVTIDAAIEGAGDVAVGNVVGSNVFNLGFILGAVAVFSDVRTDDALVARDGPVLVVAVLVLGAFLWDLSLGRAEGVALFAGLVGYVGYLFVRGRGGAEAGDSPDADPAPGVDPAEGSGADLAEEPGADLAEWPGVDPEGGSDADPAAADGDATADRFPPTADPPPPPREFSPWDLVRVVAGVVLVVVSARVLVETAVDLARMAGLSEWLIGVTVVAVGTSTPELATAVVAAGRGRGGLSAGSLVGSDLFNVLGVLGASAAISPVTVQPGATTSVAFMIGAVVLAVVLLSTGRRLSRVEGAVLVGVSALRWAIDLLL